MNCSAYRILEHGIQSREKARVIISKPKCNADGKNFDSVRLIDCYAAFMVLVYGIAISILLFGTEILTKCNINKISEMNVGVTEEEIEDE